MKEDRFLYHVRRQQEELVLSSKASDSKLRDIRAELAARHGELAKANQVS